MDTTLLFRVRETGAWRTARMLNMSRTGVLCSHDGPAPGINEAVEFVVALPVFDGGGSASVRCRGRVARLEPGPLHAERSAAALTIEEYAFAGRDEEGRES